MSSTMVSRDRMGAALGAAIWTAGAFKVAPQMPWSADIQAAVGTVAMIATGVAWPTLHARSYLRWRTPATAAVRLLMMSMPAMYDTALFDAMTPALATGHFAGAINLVTILLGTHACLLLFLALLVPLPLRSHMCVQGASLALLLLFGVHTHCRSRLFATPEFRRVVAALHDCMGLVTGVLTPLPISPPRGSYAESVSALLMTWATVGWLLPTLLLLPFEREPEAEPEGAGSAGCRGRCWQHLAGACSRMEGTVEAWLRLLVPAPRRRTRQLRSQGEQAAHGAGASCALCWVATLCVLWMLCCAVAPLYGTGEGAPSPKS